MNPEITDYINNLEEEWQADICKRVRQIIYQTVPNIEELKYMGTPHYKINKKSLCICFAAKQWVNLTVFNAEEIEAPDGFVKPDKYPDRIAAKIRKSQNFDYDLFAGALQQASQTL